MKLPVLLTEHRSWVAVHKPAGMLVEKHPAFPSVEAWLEQHLLHTGSRKPFVGVVHRLDRPVSGVLLLAKKRSSLRFLNDQFARKRVQKFYRATVSQLPEPREGKLLHFLKKDARLKQAVVVGSASGAARSELRYRFLQENEFGYELEILPLSGRYHQIRAQLSAAGFPILGDEKYGGNPWNKPSAIALRAQRLIFTDPETQERTTVSL